MKKLILTTVAFLAEAVVCLAGPPAEVTAPPPVSFFRGNEFDIGVFGTYVTGTNGSQSRTRTFADGDVVTLSTNGSANGGGGGLDFTYFLPWKYLGFRFQGTGLSLSSPTVTGSITGPDGSFRSRSNSGNAAAGIVEGGLVWRLPLDDFWPNVHLAPYAYGGGGGVFTGAGGNKIHTRFPQFNQEFEDVSSNVNNNRGLAHIGGGYEYRFTPHIGIFGEADYNWVSGGQHNFNSSVKNFIQANFGFRYAF
jgi:hypothetical protein